jgi:hypothetical protein
MLERIGEVGTSLAELATETRCEEILVLMMEEICSSEISVLKRATRHQISEDGNLHSYYRMYSVRQDKCDRNLK